MLNTRDINIRGIPVEEYNYLKQKRVNISEVVRGYIHSLYITEHEPASVEEDTHMPDKSLKEIVLEVSAKYMDNNFKINGDKFLLHQVSDIYQDVRKQTLTTEEAVKRVLENEGLLRL